MNRVHKFNKIFIFLLILFISIGFAIISTSLSISGISSISKNSWDVHFENARIKHSVEGYPLLDISDDRLSVTYSVDLKYPGDYFEFTVDTVNNGTIDAIVDTVNNTELTPLQAQVLLVEFDANENDILLSSDKKTYTVKLSYKDDIDVDDLLDTDFSVNLTFSITYKQADRSTFKTAKFKSGADVRDKMISLVSSEYSTFTQTSYGNLIPVNKFLRSSELKSGLTASNIISTSDSEVPIYIWFDKTSDNGNDVIYWYSEANIVYLNQDSSFFFYKATEGSNPASYFGNLTDVSGIYNVNTSNVVDMSALFCFCSNLQSINLFNWNTSKVTNMDYLFAYCKSLSNIDISNFDMSNATNIGHMFNGCTSLTDIDLSSFNTNKLLYMDHLFDGCTNLKNVDFGRFNTSTVQGMSYLFNSCSSLESVDIMGFDTRNVIYMDSMFQNCTNLSEILVRKGFILNPAVSSTNMFSGCISLRGSNGTTYNSSIVDATYARPDGWSYNQSTSSWNNDGSLGYFTLKTK